MLNWDGEHIIIEFKHQHVNTVTVISMLSLAYTAAEAPPHRAVDSLTFGLYLIFTTKLCGNSCGDICGHLKRHSFLPAVSAANV